MTIQPAPRYFPGLASRPTRHFGVESVLGSEGDADRRYQRARSVITANAPAHRDDSYWPADLVVNCRPTESGQG
jgi:hypothetical protein